jgi:hypothetical protein
MGATTTFKAYNCPNCNAPLTVDEAAERVTCTYCNNTFSVRRAEPEPAPPPPPPPPQIVVQAPPRRRSPLRWLSLMPISIIALTYFMLQHHGVISTVTSQLSQELPGTLGGLQWDAVATGPLIVDVDGDGYEDFLGRCRKIDPDELWVTAFAGATLEPRWRVGPLGDWNAREAVRFAVAGKRVLVSDGRHTARMIDLASGKQLGSLALSDRASDLCGDPAGARFFVATVDGASFFVSGDTPARSDGKRPAWCPRAEWPRRGHASDNVRAPRVPGFRSSYALSDGTHAVAVGEKHPGTAIPMLAGFAVGRNAADWSRLLPTIDAAQVKDGAPAVTLLSAGTLYAYYSLASLQGGRLIAVDAANGATRWDVLVPRAATGSAPEELVAGATRIYVPHWSWLDVIDAKTGSVVGTIGR